VSGSGQAAINASCSRTTCSPWARWAYVAAALWEWLKLYGDWQADVRRAIRRVANGSTADAGATMFLSCSRLGNAPRRGGIAEEMCGCVKGT
jgi:hypothetical protein